MLFGITDGLTSYVCGAIDDMNEFLFFKQKNHEGHSFVREARITEIDEHFFDPTLRRFKEEIVVIEHDSEQDQLEFFKNIPVKKLTLIDATYEHNRMLELYQIDLEREENNRIRAEAFAKGEMPRNTIGDLIGEDKFDKRTDEEKAEDAKNKENTESEILSRIANGESTIPILTNVNKEDRDAQDMSNLRREQLDDLMDDYDEEEDLVDPEELKAVMKYNEKVIHAKTDEEKAQLEEELNKNLSEKTIAARSKQKAEVAAAQKANENELFTEKLEKAKEEYKNGEHKSTEVLDREITIPALSSELIADIINNILLINQSATTVKISDLPLSAIDNGNITLPSGKAPFEIGHKTIVAWQNLKSVTRTSAFGLTSIKFNIVDPEKDCYILYCDNTIDEGNVIKAEPLLVRIKLSD